MLDSEGSRSHARDAARRIEVGVTETTETLASGDQLNMSSRAANRPKWSQSVVANPPVPCDSESGLQSGDHKLTGRHWHHA